LFAFASPEIWCGIIRLGPADAIETLLSLEYIGSLKQERVRHPPVRHSSVISIGADIFKTAEKIGQCN
jgi:hypothetical protein